METLKIIQIQILLHSEQQQKKNSVNDSSDYHQNQRTVIIFKIFYTP